MTLNTQVLTDCRIYFNGCDLTGNSNNVSVTTKVKDLQKTNFASLGYEELIGGVSSTEAKCDVMWQSGGDNSYPDDALFSALGSYSSSLTLVPTAGTVGSVTYLTQALESDYGVGGKHGELVMNTPSFTGTWPLVRGQILHPQGTARTSTGTGTACLLGAASASQRLYACLHVFSVAGTAAPTLTVKIQSDDNAGFTTPTDQFTFTAATGITGEAKYVAGAITDTYWRAAWTITGTNPSFLFAVSAGVAHF